MFEHSHTGTVLCNLLMRVVLPPQYKKYTCFLLEYVISCIKHLKTVSTHPRESFASQTSSTQQCVVQRVLTINLLLSRRQSPGSDPTRRDWRQTCLQTVVFAFWRVINEITMLTVFSELGMKWSGDQLLDVFGARLNILLKWMNNRFSLRDFDVYYYVILGDAAKNIRETKTSWGAVNLSYHSITELRL